MAVAALGGTASAGFRNRRRNNLIPTSPEPINNNVQASGVSVGAEAALP
jgi:hypothetical protein